MASALYKSVSEWNEKNDLRGSLKLHHQVWDGTPWMCDAYVGRDSKDDRRDREMRIWCRDHFGPEAWPLHEKPGRWHFGGATVDGWTWVGFDTEAAMCEFLSAWPTPEGVAPPNDTI